MNADQVYCPVKTGWSLGWIGFGLAFFEFGSGSDLLKT